MGILHRADAVITSEGLTRQHGGESEIQVAAGAVITPTGWDYIRDHRLRVVRGHGAAPSVQSRMAAPSASAVGTGGGQAASAQVREVQPPAADGTSIRPQGRCDHPDQPFGCKTDEFGSGFVAGGPVGEADFEAMVQRITDHIMERLSTT